MSEDEWRTNLVGHIVRMRRSIYDFMAAIGLIVLAFQLRQWSFPELPLFAAAGVFVFALLGSIRLRSQERRLDEALVRIIENS
jgi:hypothetical protein